MKKYLFRFKGLFIINAITITLDAFFSVLFAFVLKGITDVGVNGNVSDLMKWIVYSLIFVGISFLVTFSRQYFQALYIKKTMLHLKKELFSKLMDRDIRNFNQENSANYISTLTNDINMLQNDYFTNILQMVYYIVSFIFALVSIIMVSWVITLGVFVVMGFPILFPVLFGKKVATSKKVYSDNLSIFTSKVKDIFSGFEVIKSFNIEDKIKKEYDKSNYSVENSKYKNTIISSLVDIGSNLAGFLMFLSAMGIGTYLVIKKEVTIGSMIAAVQLMNYIVNPLTMFSNRINQLKSVDLIGKKVLEIVNVSDNPDEGILKPSFNTEISFKDVEFSYTQERKALQGASFKIKKGYKYAIVGGSGSGKSTVLKLLLRYYENFKGKILIDNIDNRDIKVEDLYKLVSVIQQNVFMFDSTIKENIELFQSYDNEKLNKAIHLSGLDELIKSLPEGENSLVGENGCNLSGGEKQRIAIARALIRNTPILVLDEATSSLDNETAYNIEKSILNIADLTSLVVTHKLIEDVLTKYDGIIAINRGRIEEIGTFEELMEKKGYFYSLYNVTKDDNDSVDELAS